MHLDSQAAVLINDLDRAALAAKSAILGIEALPVHPKYTDAITSALAAVEALDAASKAMNEGRAALHHRLEREAE